MDRQYLRSADFDKKSILANVFAPNNFDGERANADVQALVQEEQARTFSSQLAWFGVGGTIFTLYNLSRIGQLSPSGRTAAIGGFAFFAFLTYSASARAGWIGKSSAPAAPEEKKE
jgi:hypothetical protein